MTELDLPPLFLFSFFSPCCCLQQKQKQKHALFAALGFASCMQTGILLPHAENRHANAKSGEKKRRREVKFSHKGKKEVQIKFPAAGAG